MFREKSLLKSIEAAEKYGVTMIFDEILFTVLTDGWLAETPRGRLTDEYRTVLGHIVEVLGYIPENEIVSVRKAKSDYVIERPLPEVISESVATFKAGRENCEVKYTGLTCGAPLYQTPRGKIVRCSVPGANPGFTPRLTDDGILISADSDNGEAVYCLTYRPREDISTEREIELWRHLEAVQWNEWPEEETPDGQMEIEYGEDLS